MHRNHSIRLAEVILRSFSSCSKKHRSPSQSITIRMQLLRAGSSAVSGTLSCFLFTLQNTRVWNRNVSIEAWLESCAYVTIPVALSALGAFKLKPERYLEHSNTRMNKCAEFMAAARPQVAGHPAHLCRCVPCNATFETPNEATEHFGSQEHKEVFRSLTAAKGKAPPIEKFVQVPERDRPLTEEEAMIRRRMMQPLIVCEENTDFSAFIVKHDLFTPKKENPAPVIDVTHSDQSH